MVLSKERSFDQRPAPISARAESKKAKSRCQGSAEATATRPLAANPDARGTRWIRARSEPKSNQAKAPSEPKGDALRMCPGFTLRTPRKEATVQEGFVRESTAAMTPTPGPSSSDISGHGQDGSRLWAAFLHRGFWVWSARCSRQVLPSPACTDASLLFWVARWRCLTLALALPPLPSSRGRGLLPFQDRFSLGSHCAVRCSLSE